jgi:oligopeptide transport system permease protein
VGRTSLVAFALRRLLWAPVVLLLVMAATFALLRGAGGSPFRLESGGLPLPLQLELEDYYRLNEPWYAEFAGYVAHVATLDFGPSLVLRGQSVDQVVEGAFPVTGLLVLLAAAWALPIGLALGLAAGLRRGTLVDTALSAIATSLLAIPVFLVANAASRLLVADWGLVPFGWDSGRTKAVASLTLALAPAGYIARLTRAAVADTAVADFVRTARAKGLRGPRIAVVHVLRNAVAPILGAIVPTLGLLVTGTFFVESRFGIPGAGSFFVSAAKDRDYPMVLGLTVALAAVMLAALLVADVVAAALDPRVREQERGR